MDDERAKLEKTINNTDNKSEFSIKSEKNKKKRGKKISIILFSILFLMVGLVGFLFLIKYDFLDFKKEGDSADHEYYYVEGQRSESEQIYIDAIDMASSGNYQLAQQELDKLLEIAKDDNDLMIYAYAAKISLGLNHDDCQLAYDLSIRLDEISSSFNTKKLIAEASYCLGNKNEALDYYRQAEKLIVGDGELEVSDRLYIESVIREIEGV